MKRWSRLILAYKGALIIILGAILAGSVYAVYRAKSVPTTIISPAQDLEVEVINVLPTGCEPAEIVRPAGPFVLHFDNQTRLRPLEFRVERTGMPVVAPIEISRKTATKVLNLAPGEYRVSEATHPDWSVTITILKR